ncbi:thiamine phosphate synthase [Nitratifractor salsuginis]|uniref:Thiamine monophosphate synthase n=1 Tax=Nitratifractor salsuginis (strain DSM 16511 / JCM 12458 / E9I37-1) TaxID=749222 RepID=E6X002_NITSE|nr:thiamine phosphate synthase [Nitratifractor salsuginis]ADV46725.1 thiamine monophosphate synthase [Nitratifractor salsuginis DSM 16511]
MPQETEIYALIDSRLLRRYDLSLARVGRFLEEAKIPIAQYRDKEASDADVARALEELRIYYSGTLIVNDRLGLAGLADGLHLGQEDLAAIDPDSEAAVSKVRRQIGSKLLGLSTHNREEIETANALDLDYIGLGAYRSTATKADAGVSGKALLELARLSRHPVALIGGVRWEDRFEAPIRYKVLGSALMERIANL